MHEKASLFFSPSFSGDNGIQDHRSQLFRGLSDRMECINLVKSRIDVRFAIAFELYHEFRNNMQKKGKNCRSRFIFVLRQQVLEPVSETVSRCSHVPTQHSFSFYQARYISSVFYLFHNFNNRFSGIFSV